MKLTCRIKLNTSADQFQSLVDTVIRFNSACNYISDFCFKQKIFSAFKVQKHLYYDVKEKYQLTAQMVIRCIGKVCSAYRSGPYRKRVFKDKGSIVYDNRILSYKISDKTINIWTVNGRITIPFSVGDKQQYLVKSIKGETDLHLKKGKLYLLSTCDIREADEVNTDEAIGVDLGLNNIAVTSDGLIYSGTKVDEVRNKYQRRISSLQKIGTKSAKRRLKKISGKESLFRRDTNHVISKKIVGIAKDTNCSISIEELKGIRTKTTVRKSEKRRHSSWAFLQLKLFILYKAKLSGVRVVVVCPKYTSKRCNRCGHIENANRSSQSFFSCKKCNHEDNADLNGAKNIKLLGQYQLAYGSNFIFNKLAAIPVINNTGKLVED